jgi:hypothetical protein
MLAVSEDEAAHLKAAEIWTQKKTEFIQAAPLNSKTVRKGKIRIGYFSADFRNHPVANLAAGLFEAHDQERYETYAFSYGPAGEDAMRQRLKSAFHQFIDVTKKTTDQIVELARNLDLDIAVDLTGHTEHNRIEIFAHRVAPAQINYLGYPGTMGAPFYDYIIADPVLIPKEQQKYYSEKIIYLPDTYQPNDRAREIANRQFTRAELGLPEVGFVFACFNNNFKITPAIFEIWMRLLAKVEGSVLWLFEDNSRLAKNLQSQALKCGINPDRLIFAKRMILSEHLARHRLIDLFLDTAPYNAHTTASDALWCGVPLLTYSGKSFASRVASSLLKAIDLEELVATSLSEYESKALKLATEPALLQALKEKLARNRMTCKLFDTADYARNLEAVYEDVYSRY